MADTQPLCGSAQMWERTLTVGVRPYTHKQNILCDSVHVRKSMCVQVFIHEDKYGQGEEKCIFT